jgi:hypothetical protein
MADATDHPKHAAEPDRRQFLRRAAVVGTGIFVVPTIITLDPASAQAITSPPPEPPEPPTEVGGATLPRDAAGTQVAGTQVAGRTTLPRTGAELDDLVKAGLAAIAGGSALVLWSADLESSD